MTYNLKFFPVNHASILRYLSSYIIILLPFCFVNQKFPSVFVILVVFFHKILRLILQSIIIFIFDSALFFDYYCEPCMFFVAILYSIRPFSLTRFYLLFCHLLLFCPASCSFFSFSSFISCSIFCNSGIWL